MTPWETTSNGTLWETAPAYCPKQGAPTNLQRLPPSIEAPPVSASLSLSALQ